MIIRNYLDKEKISFFSFRYFYLNDGDFPHVGHMKIKLLEGLI